MSTKRKASARFAPPTTKSAIKLSTKNTIDESRAAVSATDNVQTVLKAPQTDDAIEISSDESDCEADSDDAMNGVENTEAAANGTTTSTSTSTQPAAGAAKTSESNDDVDDDDEETSPSFGELLRGTIDVPALLSQTPADKGALTKPSTALAPPSLSSLGTVLAQALRTEDTELLESCLQVTDPDSVQQTIERLDSALAGVLLSKLAARFHRRPGRAGSLMAWVKWTLVAHGGALAVQPKVLDRLVSLQKVLNERSRGLPSLLALKGKLDMLDAQMHLRQARRRRRGVEEEEEDSDEEDDDAIYVEGEEVGDVPALNGGLGDDDDEDAAINGFAADSDVDDDEDDLEADEIGDSEDEEDELDEDEVDHDDVEDDASDDESDVEAAPPAKVQKTARAFGKRR